MTRTTYPLVALLILDGWGLATPGPGNAVSLADTTNFDALWAAYPHTQLAASGEDVGLPAGQIGNSEVGHLNLGGGRVVLQDLPRINRAVATGELARNPELQAAIAAAKSGSGTLHVIGLASTGGVHSHIAHIEAIVEAAAAAGVPYVSVHAITDGRDVSPDASLTDIPRLEAACAAAAAAHGVDARVATVIGRYWAMDRDKRWDRTKRAYDVLAAGIGEHAPTATDAVRASHAAHTTDEFIEPYVVHRGAQDAAADPFAIHDGDAVVFANFRPDRARQLSHALTDPDFAEFERSPRVRVQLTTMTRYDDVLTAPVLFAEQRLTGTLADAIEAAGAKQLHEAETEKYAHVTYFFNGGVEQVHTDEERILVPSPRDVATYDEKPEMSAPEVARRFVEAVVNPEVRFAVLNFANPDMVGHTGSIPAATAAVSTVDGLLDDVVGAILARGGVALITADHGNAEVMLTPEGKPHTAHTTNPVPLIVTLPVEHGEHVELRSGGRLGDIAPTILALLGIEAPAEMTGTPLITPAAIPTHS